MIQPRMRHAILAATALAFLLPTPGRAAQDDQGKDAGKHPIHVAVLPFVNATADLGAPKIMGDILGDQLKQVPADRAVFLLPDDVERILTPVDRFGSAMAITDRWGKYQTLDSTSVVGLDSLLTCGSILLVKISEWENHRVPVVGAGQSSTTIGLSFALYDIRTKKLLWSKHPREQRFAQEIDPSSANVSYDATGVIQRSSDSQPPRYESVAADLLRDAFKKFPQK